VNAEAPGTPAFRHPAMATLFEVMIAGEEELFASQAAQAVFEELDRLEQDLSRFLPNSDVSRINNLPPRGHTPVSETTFECLLLSRRYWEETFGAFDITLGAVMDSWVGRDTSLLAPDAGSLAAARSLSGMEHLILDESSLVVAVGERTPRLDLGAIGKGYAVDRAVTVLKEWGVGAALVHGGTSSAFGFGAPEHSGGWPLTVSSFVDRSTTLRRVVMRDEALSGSGIRKGLHIIDPRTMAPAGTRQAAWVIAPSAAESDAVSTACMTLDREGIKTLCDRNRRIGVLVIDAGEGPERDRVATFGSRWNESDGRA
jgi:thiamine biosynthesis lipoprotein